MDALLVIAGLTTVTVVTPGPNNVVVMSRGAASGLKGALPAIVGILSGTVAMTAFALWSFRAMSATTLARGSVWICASMLVLMAVSMWRHAGEDEEGIAGLSPIGLALFQLANPKAWVAVSTVAAAGAVAGVAPGAIMALTVIISALGLALWAGGGALLSTWLSFGNRRRTFDRLLAISLLLPAVSLLFL